MANRFQHSVHDSLNRTRLGFTQHWYGMLTNGFNLEAGNRLNFHSEYGTNDVFNINPSYLINKKLKLFANLSTGYRTPSLYQLFSEYGNRELDPEKAFTVEAGLQIYGNKENWNARAVFFHRDVKDLIFFYFNPVTFQSQYINQDEQKDNGVELELTYNITKKTFVKAFYAYVDGEVTTSTKWKGYQFQ